MSGKYFSTLFFVLSFLFFGIIPAWGTERLCDVSFEDCRAPLLNLIRNENVEIDVAFWFMDDTTISNALIKKFQSGVPVRILVDPPADDGHSTNTQILADMASPGFPLPEPVAN